MLIIKSTPIFVILFSNAWSQTAGQFDSFSNDYKKITFSMSSTEKFNFEDSTSGKSFKNVFFENSKGFIKFSRTMDKQKWTHLGLTTLGVIAVGAFLDQNLKTLANENSSVSMHQFFGEIGKFGEDYSFGVIGAFYLSNLLGYRKGKVVAFDCLSASIFSSGVVTPFLKTVMGRERPNTNGETYGFEPFSGENSFPSGHTTQAFAVASVIASHYNNLWIQSAAYGIAGLVGFSRVEKNAHYTSDVLAGAFIGNFIGRKVAGRSFLHRERFDLEPYVGSEGIGVSFNIKPN